MCIEVWRFAFGAIGSPTFGRLYAADDYIKSVIDEADLFPDCLTARINDRPEQPPDSAQEESRVLYLPALFHP